MLLKKPTGAPVWWVCTIFGVLKRHGGTVGADTKHRFCAGILGSSPSSLSDQVLATLVRHCEVPEYRSAAPGARTTFI
jgi:hypothetical protein